MVPADGGGLPAEALAELEGAVEVLEFPSFLVRLADSLGAPVEWALKLLERRLPGGGALLHSSVEKALMAAARLAVRSLDGGRTGTRRAGERWHRRAAAVSGAVGGALGAPGLAVELPVTTTLILRAIADVAREEGEDLTRLEARLACLEVFALGGRSSSDDAAESAYFAIRLALARTVRRITGGGMGETVGRLVVRIAPRFEIAVGEKLAAQAAPVIGALGGAAINVAFTRHFQRIARAHFTVRRLERVYGEDPVRRAYGELSGRVHGRR